MLLAENHLTNLVDWFHLKFMTPSHSQVCNNAQQSYLSSQWVHCPAVQSEGSFSPQTMHIPSFLSYWPCLRQSRNHQTIELYILPSIHKPCTCAHVLCLLSCYLVFLLPPKTKPLLVFWICSHLLKNSALLVVLSLFCISLSSLLAILISLFENVLLFRICFFLKKVLL